MAATTLSNSFPRSSDAVAVIIPNRPNPVTITYARLNSLIESFQTKLAAIGITSESAVSIALPNTLEFIVSFLATAAQRAIAAPLNSAYKQEEFEFYIDDLKSALALVPKGEFAKDGAAVRAARRFQAAIAECWWDDAKGEVVLDVKDLGRLKGKGNKMVETAQPEDIALVLHTSGTTGRPKAVPLTHRNLTRTMSRWMPRKTSNASANYEQKTSKLPMSSHLPTVHTLSCRCLLDVPMITEQGEERAAEGECEGWNSQLETEDPRWGCWRAKMWKQIEAFEMPESWR